MRAKLVEGFNGMLEDDHQLLLETMMTPFELSDTSLLIGTRYAIEVSGKHYATGLDLIGYMEDGKPIVAVYEDGIIQGFK